ncbi:undecaprenyl-phosphate glucose phosphotransferase [Flammeovirga kamogawensis]|uniref:Undecaprenyl-phosphate glucose phosphotransferase n=1 Tax=Flammeovirga kamogawensis TaxID=373891 RepID=A0ABX8GSM9_9BACT|nr:undecaprenyl-phosphate glucose phosphotransferase [Flammeovirga kamogawensis]MBB6461534.1 Undecaprenyl-phosphate glucose phosphotransferase [Flammeovirga kamogawensis]QWG06424.1 undecaprenyl-phosphate glucose phosphotransferase [Flammeovirga kamogawensis]TRX68253.1 undecaprenyl-phosphate glucose phosphotransferase [Flammeovirga kamogawensis]
MSVGKTKYLGAINLAIDLFILNISFLISVWLKFDQLSPRWAQESYEVFWFGLNTIWIILSLIIKPYSFSRTKRVIGVLRQYFFVLLLHAMSISTLLVFVKFTDVSREILVNLYLSFAFLLSITKVVGIYLMRMYRRQGFSYKNVAVLGYGPLAVEVRKFFRVHPEYGFRFLGFFDDHSKEMYVEGQIKDFKDFAINKDVNEVYCCIPYVDYELIRELIDWGESHMIKVKLITDFRGFASKGITLDRYDEIPVLDVSPVPLDDQQNQLVKRVFDTAFSFSVIVLLMSWLTPLMALIIKIESKGPVFFKQKRTGKDGKAFWCYKFRSMAVNTDSDAKQATKGDMRITKVGAFIRKTSIDELPQFFNVFLGNMSVVGPRPHMLRHTEEYTKVVEKFMSRHLVKPGITGLAQARGYRGETENDDYAMKGRVKLDRFYVNNWSLWFDVQIIIDTVMGIVNGDEKAY